MINPVKMYYVSSWLYRHNVPFIPRIIQLLIFLLFNAVVPYKTSIGKKCIIAHGGSGVVINDPVVIGDHSAIGANAVVTKSIPSHCVAAGVPAKIIKTDISAHDVEVW